MGVKVAGGVVRLTGRVGRKSPEVLMQLNDCIKPLPQCDQSILVLPAYNLS